jgi:hypothetical protein
MPQEQTNGPLELLPLSEVARRGKVCHETLKRHVAANHITPDAVLVGGRKRVKLFVPAREASLLDLLNK